MTNKEIAVALVNKGFTYEAVGNVLGISRQAVHQFVRYRVTNHNSLGRKTIYPNLLKWSIEHKCTKSIFLTRMGFEADCGNIAKLSRVLSGKQQPSKNYIDKMLQVTGLSYEMMFEVFTDGD